MTTTQPDLQLKAEQAAKEIERKFTEEFLSLVRKYGVEFSVTADHHGDAHASVWRYPTWDAQGDPVTGTVDFELPTWTQGK